MANPPKADAAHQKDACSFSIDLSKEFLGLASAGVAFLVGLVFAGSQPLPPAAVILAISLFSASLLMGWLYLMNVISYITRYENYDVYGPRHRFLVVLQILFFVIPIGVLGITTYGYVSKDPAPGKASLSVDGVIISGFQHDSVSSFSITPDSGVLLRIRPTR